MTRPFVEQSTQRMSIRDTDARRSASHEGEEALVARMRLGDADAFEQLFRSYYDSLWRFAFGFVGSRAVAEELVQDVMLEVWTGRGTWVVRSSVKAYLYGAVRNQALNVQRRKRLELRYEERAVTEGLVADMTVPGAEIDERLTDERRRFEGKWLCRPRLFPGNR